MAPYKPELSGTRHCQGNVKLLSGSSVCTQPRATLPGHDAGSAKGGLSRGKEGRQTQEAKRKTHRFDSEVARRSIDNDERGLERARRKQVGMLESARAR